MSAAQWEAVAGQRIFFGHQSVGGNILQGIRDLATAQPPAALRIVTSNDPAAVRGPALVESLVGENGNPRSKAADFAAALARGFGREAGIAMYKLCYVDTDRGTDPARLFASYRDEIAALRREYPKLTIVHFTQPLTTASYNAEHPLKRLAKQVLGRPTAADLNAQRDQYNALLRREYGGKEPLFDLAHLESVRPDGTRSLSAARTTAAPSLAPEWSEDGGHLNVAGRQMVARELLHLLASLA